MSARRFIPAAVAGALAALLWAVFQTGFLNYDTEYALVWGRDLVEGRTPDYDVAFAPTPHPLTNALGALLALPGGGSVPQGAFAENAWLVLAFLALGTLGWLVFALGREWFGPAAGAVAAAIVLTREPVLSFGLRAYVDVLYLCLLLGALLVEARRPRAGGPVLVLIALAGLVRPEAWLFAGAYVLWLGTWRPADLALAAAAPLIWAGSDLLVTGDPLHSLTGTRENADELRRVTGLDDVPLTLPRRLGEILREPGLLGAAGGGVLALWRLRDRAALPAAAGLVAVAAFCVLAAAGLPILTRYLLLPAALLAIFCGAAVAGWTALARNDPWRQRWLAFGALVVVAFAAFAPAQHGRLDRLQAALSTQEAILDELRSFFPRPVDPVACSPLTLPNRRAVPQVALWTGLAPRAIRSGQDEGVAGTYLAPASPQVAEQFVLDRRDRNRRLPRAPRSDRVVRRTWWTAHLVCRP